MKRIPSYFRDVALDPETAGRFEGRWYDLARALIRISVTGTRSRQRPSHLLTTIMDDVRDNGVAVEERRKLENALNPPAHLSIHCPTPWLVAPPETIKVLTLARYERLVGIYHPDQAEKMLWEELDRTELDHPEGWSEREATFKEALREAREIRVAHKTEHQQKMDAYRGLRVDLERDQVREERASRAALATAAAS